MAISLYENMRALLYAPFYATEALGHYASEGVAVERRLAPYVGAPARAVVDGTVDVGWGGPMRVMKEHDDDPASPLICFGEVVARDPFTLVGRTPNPGFDLAELTRLRFASVSEVPTPWLCLQQDLRDRGVDPASVNRIADRPMAQNIAALAADEVDVVQLFEPFVEEAVARGIGHVWRAATSRGLTCYTTFMTARRTMESRQDELRRMVRAMRRTLRWLAEAAPAEIARAVSEFFPDQKLELLSGALGRYQATGIWATDGTVSEDGFDRLRSGLVSGGFIRRPIPFADCVDNRLTMLPGGG
jgi:NitT/TauT family transport system substrate-binding protein